jgi:hypothetical protein
MLPRTAGLWIGLERSNPGLLLSYSAFLVKLIREAACGTSHIAKRLQDFVWHRLGIRSSWELASRTAYIMALAVFKATDEVSILEWR